MCGIIAAIAQRDVVPILMQGLQALEYRGYDSAGMAVINNNKFGLIKEQGKVKVLHAAVKKQLVQAKIGIAHTRWATHGKPSAVNAHPHVFNSIAIVHNGIIENYHELQAELKNKYQVTFKSDTDSEVIAAKIYCYQQQGLDLVAAVKKTCKQLRGAYAICVLDKNHPDCIVAAKFGSPLVVGVGVGEYFVASDNLALQNLTQNVIHLQDGDLITVTRDAIAIVDYNTGKKIKRQPSSITAVPETVDKGAYRHYMQKEIFEQPLAVINTMEGRITKNLVLTDFLGVGAKQILAKTKHIQIIACGTSFYAGLVAKAWFEELLGINCQVDIASEFRYGKPVVLDNTLLISISQSGETADTIAALKDTIYPGNVNLKKYSGFLTICNVPQSSLVRYASLVALTKAGPEIGVASTKAFTTQLVNLAMLMAILLGEREQNKDHLAALTVKQIVNDLKVLPAILEKYLELAKPIKGLAKLFEHKKSALFLARGKLLPIALEGALKMKELSYIHAEAYPAGELKHGPLALVDDEMPVIVLMSKDHLVDKLKANIQEVEARGGQVIVFADQEIKWKSKKNIQVVPLPSVPEWLAPITYVLPMQLLAYYVALLKGTDVDQPRNLAKSVTVE